MSTPDLDLHTGRQRTRRFVVVFLPLLLAAAGGRELGYGRAATSWQETTGWSAIPAAERPAPAPGRAALADHGPRLDWLGHAGFVLRWHGTTLLLDPNTSSHCTVAPRVLEPPADVQTLGRVDAALISHAHFDHLDLPTLERVEQLERVLVPAGSESYVAGLEDVGTRIVGLEPGDALRVGELELIAVPAAHNGNRLHPLASRKLAVGWIVRHGDETVFFAGDSGYGPHFAEIGRRYRPQLAILPIGAFSPRFPLARYHLSPEEAVQAARDLGTELVVPAHFGTFRLSLDRPDTALPRFAAAAGQAGLAWRMPRLLVSRSQSQRSDRPIHTALHLDPSELSW